MQTLAQHFTDYPLIYMTYFKHETPNNRH